jgi:hypothetical protein
MQRCSIIAAIRQARLPKPSASLCQRFELCMIPVVESRIATFMLRGQLGNFETTENKEKFL